MYYDIIYIAKILAPRADPTRIINNIQQCNKNHKCLIMVYTLESYLSENYSNVMFFKANKHHRGKWHISMITSILHAFDKIKEMNIDFKYLSFFNDSQIFVKQLDITQIESNLVTPTGRQLDKIPNGWHYPSLKAHKSLMNFCQENDIIISGYQYNGQTTDKQTFDKIYPYFVKLKESGIINHSSPHCYPLDEIIFASVIATVKGKLTKMCRIWWDGNTDSKMLHYCDHSMKRNELEYTQIKFARYCLYDKIEKDIN